MSEIDHKAVMVGMIILGKLYSANADEQGNAIAGLLIGEYDHELTHAFAYKSDMETGIKQLAELKDAFRKTLQMAINQEAERSQRRAAYEACEKFMGNQEPHALGTTAELAEKYSVSKKQIRKMKQDGTLEEFINAKS